MALISTALNRISLTTANASALATFYEIALGFTQTDSSRVDAGLYGLDGSHAQVVTLSLGEQLIELVQFEQPGAPYPANPSSTDPWFQHFAIVVADIGAAWQQLRQVGGFTAISQGQPVTLPASSGGISAIKLRDPELHPFELIQYPAGAVPAQWAGLQPQNGVALGIDHSAIVVSNTTASVNFYADLGFSVSTSGLNQGSTQDQLDGTTGAVVQVTRMQPAQATPGLELLCYSTPAAAQPITVAPNDIAATRLVVSVATPPSMLGTMLDPDGHRVTLVELLGWGQPGT